MTDARWKAGLVRYVPEDVARYRDHGVWGELTISEEFHRSALRFPDDLAVITPENRLTYRELDELSDRLALGLLDLGLTPGDRVLFQVTNRWETVAAWYGVLKAGLIPVATLAAHRAHEISDTARRSGAVAHLVEAGTANFDLVSFAQEQAAATPALRFLLTISAGSDAPGRRIEDLWAAGDAGAARSAVEAVQEAILPDDVAVFQLSGGTTGVPKIIPRLQAEYWYNARRYAEALRFGPTTKNSHAGPVIHNAGIVCAVHGPHSGGGATVLPGPDVRARIPFLVEEGITDILIGRVNFVLVTEDAFQPVLKNLRGVIFSGGKVPAAAFAHLEELGVPSGQLFGMGEGLFTVSDFDAPARARGTTIGRPISELDA